MARYGHDMLGFRSRSSSVIEVACRQWYIYFSKSSFFWEILYFPKEYFVDIILSFYVIYFTWPLQKYVKTPIQLINVEQKRSIRTIRSLSVRTFSLLDCFSSFLWVFFRMIPCHIHWLSAFSIRTIGKIANLQFSKGFSSPCYKNTAFIEQTLSCSPSTSYKLNEVNCFGKYGLQLRSCASQRLRTPILFLYK